VEEEEERRRCCGRKRVVKGRKSGLMGGLTAIACVYKRKQASSS
jgi:hypothetical protein